MATVDPEQALEEITEILYPGGDLDNEWSVEDLNHIAAVLREYGFEPESA